MKSVPALLVMIAVVASTGLAATEASAASPGAVLELNTTYRPSYPYSGNHVGDPTNTTVSPGASATTGITVTGPAGSVSIQPPIDGSGIRVGRYPWISNSETHTNAPQVFIPNLGFPGGDLDVLDLGTNPDGTLSRFDIVFRGIVNAGDAGPFGELRYNEPEDAVVAFTARHLEFPLTPVGSIPITAAETLRNLTSTAKAIGAITRTGSEAGDFAVTGDGCSNSTLAPGASCSLTIGYSPKAGGPRVAALSIPVAGVTQTVSLAGDAPLGTTSITFSGNDYVSGGKTNVFSNGPTDIVQNRVDNFRFMSSTPYGSADPQGVTAFFTAPNGVIATGTHATVSPGDPNSYGESIYAYGRGCGMYRGSETVHSFDVRPDGTVDMADIDVTQVCTIDPTHPLTGHFQWQVRSDRIAPASVTGVTVSGGAVRWTASPSTDVRTTIARLVEGDGRNATPVSGLPLSAGTATSAVLPALIPGVRYTAVVFPVDITGNVGGPAAAPIGTVSSPKVPGAPTNVSAVAGDGSATVSLSPPASDGGSPILRYEVISSIGGHQASGTASPIVVRSLTNGTPTTFTVQAINAVGGSIASQPSAPVTPHVATPPPASPELLPDPGFEKGSGGWVPFIVGAFTRVSTPIHGGGSALQIAATGSKPTLVGMTQNTAVASSVLGKSYTASCWVRPTAPNLSVSMEILEYTPNFSSNIHSTKTTIASLPAGTWTKVSVAFTAAKAGERIIPQIYSTTETTATGSLVYDDCSLK